MQFLVILYVFLLFVLLVNNSLFSRFFAFKGKQLPPHLVSAFAFALVLYLTYDYVDPYYKESMIILNNTTSLEDKIVEKTKDSVDNEWVIIPPKEIDTPPSPPDFKVLPIQCAANYGEATACCGQPPAIIPYENTCRAEKPFCNGYVEKEQWGTCGIDKEEQLQPSEFQESPTEELIQNIFNDKWFI